MALPAAIVSGTMMFVLMGVIACICGGLFFCTGRMDKQSTRLYLTLVPVAGVGMWLMWLCTWLHQWHPLVDPIPFPAEGASG